VDYCTPRADDLASVPPLAARTGDGPGRGARRDQVRRSMTRPAGVPVRR